MHRTDAMIESAVVAYFYSTFKFDYWSPPARSLRADCTWVFWKLVLRTLARALRHTWANTRRDDPTLPLSNASGMYNKERIDPRKQTSVRVRPQGLTGDAFLSKRHTKMQ